MRPEILNFLFTSISNLSGVGDKTKQNYIRLLTKKKVAAGESLDPKMFNLLFHLPERVLRRRIIDNVGEITDGDVITAKVKVISHNPPGRTKQPYTITCFLGQNFLNIVYYTYYENYINVKFRIDGEVFVSGRIEFYNSQLQMVHPDYVATKITDIPQLEPIYPLTYNLSNREVSKNVDFIMNNCPDLPEWLEEGILKANDWVSWRESLLNLHYPKCVFDMVNNKYIKRLAFDEILAQQLALAMVRSSDARRNEKQILENKTKSLKNKFLNEILQFELTNDQLNAIAEIEGNTFSSKKMMRLLQGDVGSGKTVVAFVSMLNYVENKKQCVLMVPTSILAAQHFETITGFCEKLGLNVGILTSKIKGKVRNATLQKLKSGDINILVGTHALIEDNVEFKDLGFVIIDEQHRFGVEQRMLLINKNKNADILAMSATPIPRTLALTIYSDMDLSVLREKPKNRKEIITSIVTVDKYDNLIGRIRERIKGDEKVYWICPLVEESKNMELTDIRNKYDEFCELFGSENIAFLHGRMKEKEKDAVMEDFCENRRKKILISTTVVEVGIDVKEASIIVIDHPERFGLSQLHQLRGRVGRSDKQSYCILLFDHRNGGKNTLRRLNIIRSTNNGFTIAEQDLKIRGIGEIMGLKQSGQQDYLIADLDRDFGLLEQALHLVPGIIKSNSEGKYRILLHLFGYANYLRKSD